MPSRRRTEQTPTLDIVNSTIKNADVDARGTADRHYSDADLLSVLQKIDQAAPESVELSTRRHAELAPRSAKIAIISAYLRTVFDDEMKPRSGGDRRDQRDSMKDMDHMIEHAADEIRRPDGFQQGSGSVKAALTS